MSGLNKITLLTLDLSVSDLENHLKYKVNRARTLGSVRKVVASMKDAVKFSEMLHLRVRTNKKPPVWDL